MKKIWIIAAAALAFASSPGASQAGPFGEFEAELRAVYAPYRSALFATNLKNPSNSEKTTEALAKGWTQLVEKWRAAPPPQYADDPQFAGTLDRIGATISTARAQIAASELAEAHETLEKIRGELAGLRQRNNVRSFSDVVNEYHEAMEGTLAQARTEPDPGALRERAALLVHLAKKLAAAPPADVRNPSEVAEQAEAVVQSAQALHTAAKSGDAAAIQAALAGLKRPYAAFFVNFG